MTFRGTLVLFVLLSLSLPSSYGQGTTSKAFGVVQDSSGAVVPNATVRMIHEGTNATFTTVSSEAGTFGFEALQPGPYTVTVEAAGFKKFTSRGNLVTIGQPTTVRVTLEVGEVNQSVEVAAVAETVQTSSSGNFGNLLTGDLIRELPIVGTRGRNPLELVLRQPGVVAGANTGGGVHVHGARDRAWNFTLDGIDTNETSAGGANFSPLRTNPDSLAEFRVITGNTTAEFGRNSGGQVAMVTRSGTNEVHGSLFWFYRTPRLNANEWENNLNRLGKRQFVQQIPGFSMGGPIQKNRTFYFGNLQVLRARESAQVDRTVYTQTARQGIFRYVRGGRNTPFGAPGASIDANGNPLPELSIGSYNIFANDPERRGLNARIRSLIEATPLPNNFTGGDGLNTALFTFTALQLERQYDATIKIDHILNAKNTVYARIAWGRQDTNCDRVNGGTPFFPGGGCVVNTERDPRNLAFNWRTNPSPRWTNELVVGQNTFAFDFVIPTASLDKITLTGAPVTIPETFDFGNKRRLTTWQFVDNLSYFRGAHAFKFGTNLRFQRHVDTRGSIGGANATQSVNFSRLINTVDPARFALPADINVQFDRPALESSINYMLGRVGSTTRGFPSRGDQFVAGLYNFDARFPEYDFFAQDTWKVRKNLTLDIGLRLEMKLTPRSSPSGRIRRPNQAAVHGGTPSTTLRWETGELYPNQLWNFGPSFGFAWDPFGKGKTSIRSNYRIAYDRLNTFVLSSSVFQNLPGQVQGVVNQEYGQNGGRLDGLPVLTPPTVRPSELAQPAPFSLNAITVVDPNFEVPTTHQWAFSIQQEVAPRTVLEVSYIGRRAHNLYGAYNANQTEIIRNGFVDAFRTVAAGGESDLINRLTLPDTRRGANETGSAMLRRLFPSELRNNAVGTIASDLARRIQGGRSLSDLAGFGPFFFVPYPQFTGALNVLDTNDFSTYHALEVQIERRYHNGVTAQLSYTLSKSLDTRSFDPAFTVVSTGNAQSASSTPFDINNRRLNYALSDFDRTHAVQSYFSYELPFGKGKRFASGVGSLANRLVAGWQASGFFTLVSGRPMTVYSGFNTFANVVQSTGSCNGCTRSEGGVFDGPGGFIWYFDQNTINKFQTPAAGDLGNTGRNFFRGPGSFNMDISFRKMTDISERFKLELRADMINFTNTPTFGFPTLTVSSTIFGRIRDTLASGSRKIQLGAKIHF
ncbi:MAG: TonB-dependent receptor [Bryobacteraceae bacterium]|nr:TonB-dependent receptor [Bryobacteraceae bacterium]MDW8380210.1 TonB-dependent receptor [Bryobacterales bacterium]